MHILPKDSKEEQTIKQALDRFVNNIEDPSVTYDRAYNLFLRSLRRQMYKVYIDAYEKGQGLK